VFDRWTGDVTSIANPLNLTMTQPYNVAAIFAAPLAVSSSAAPNPVLGKAYSHLFTASGGNGTNAWTLLSGNLPTGLTLSGGGVLSGVPTALGSFSAVVRVTSGAQSAQVNVNISVTEPTLALSTVLPHLLGTTSGLTTDDIKYLDLIGNNNNVYDVGDFLAWVNRTDAAPASPPAIPPDAAAQAEGTVTP
jgi:hypothetical protein